MADRQGRDEEFTRFVAASSGALTRLAWFLTGNADLVADVVQDAYVKTYLAWGRVRTEDALAYARTVVVNTNIDRLRRRHGETALPEGYDRADPGDAADDVAERDRVARMLATLPARQRQVVVLRYELDLSEQDTAAMLGISVGTVKSAAARALARLRSQNSLSTPEEEYTR